MSGIYNYFFNRSPVGELIYRRVPTTTPEERVQRLFLSQWDLVTAPQTFHDREPPVRGFHGSSQERLGLQLEGGKFENRNRRIYVTRDQGTAIEYAQSAHHKGEQGVLLLLSSWNDKKANNWNNPRKGPYVYFPKGEEQEVFIEEAWLVNSPAEASFKQSLPAL